MFRACNRRRDCGMNTFRVTEIESDTLQMWTMCVKRLHAQANHICAKDVLQLVDFRCECLSLCICASVCVMPIWAAQSLSFTTISLWRCSSAKSSITNLRSFCALIHHLTSLMSPRKKIQIYLDSHSSFLLNESNYLKQYNIFIYFIGVRFFFFSFRIYIRDECMKIFCFGVNSEITK